MGWLVSRYPRDMYLDIKEMKRSGMTRPLPVINIPILLGLNSEIDGTVAICLTAHSALVAAQGSMSSARSLIADCFEIYAQSLGNYAEDLAKYAGSIDQSLANAAATSSFDKIELAIMNAKCNPDLQLAAQAAELAGISVLASIAMALATYAINVNTAEDRVTAIRVSEKQIAKCEAFKNEYGM
jgi:hypothetical protein